MNSEARRAQRDGGKIGGPRVLQPLRDLGRERQFEPVVEADDDLVAALNLLV